ncbi:MAG: hypothetical protein DMG05_12015 [Acidobacteria bacterium]|nr:MAG: hypothetical protein DMG05_12015 [Acidobacteriota bacterium]
MWKSRKPEEEKETQVNRKEELPMSVFVEREPVETRLEPRTTPGKQEVINIGKSVSIKGELTGDEDLTIEGRVEGKIELKDHNLVIGPHGTIKGQINAKNVTVKGKVLGNVSARELVEIKASGSVAGDIESLQISIVDGAYFKGRVDLRRGPATERSHSPKPEAAKVNSEQGGLAGLQAI